MKDSLRFLATELSEVPTGAIIGIQPNPDIYQGLDSIGSILDLLIEYNLGLYLETTSLKLIDDLPLLKAFATNHPLLIAVHVATLQCESRLLGDDLSIKHATKIISRFSTEEIQIGAIIKPIIPLINDDVDDFVLLIEQLIKLNIDFLYTTRSIRFDSNKIKAFYDAIDTEFPELMKQYKEIYGHKLVWESPKADALKKQFVILSKKARIAYAMKDIINLYKPDLNVQLKLF
jgi:DNA repair photolyase